MGIGDYIKDDPKMRFESDWNDFKISVEISADVNIHQAIEAFANFLRAAGYNEDLVKESFNLKKEYIKDDQDE